jgi:tight adherence protein B
MSGIVLFLMFLFIFSVVLLAFKVGFNVADVQKKKKVTEMLQSAVGEAQRVETKVLLDAGKDRAAALTKLLSRFNVARVMEQRIQQAGLTMTVSGLLLMMVVLAVAGALIGTRFNVLLYRGPSCAALAFVGAVIPYVYVSRTRTKRMGKFEEQFPEALDFLARAMRAGHAFSISLEMLSEESPQPLAGEFRKAFNEISLGLPVETALNNMVDRVPLLDLKFFVSAVLLQRETGGNLAEILQNLAHVIRERFKLKGQVRAASAHGRLTGTILTLMPIVTGFGLMTISPTYLRGMANDSDGRKMIAAVIVLVILGHFSIRKIVNIKV